MISRAWQTDVQPKLLAYVDALIARIKRGWTKGVYARDISGHAQLPGSPWATCWCLSGAMLVENDPYDREVRRMLSAAIRNEIVGQMIVHWNDHPGRTQQDVIDMLERVKKRIATDVPIHSIR